MVTAIKAYNYIHRAWQTSHSIEALRSDEVSTKYAVHGLASLVEDALDELGFVLAMEYQARVEPQGCGKYRCLVDGHSAIGNTWSEAVIRASLLRLNSAETQR